MSLIDIQDLISANEPLASLPNTFYKLREVVSNPNCDFDDIAEIISLDPSLTLRLLKIVNSAFYGFRGEVETIPHAMGIVGTEQLMQLVLATTVVGQFKNIPKDMVNMEYFWKHSVACGLAARAINEVREANEGESIFVAGLLHDVGRLVMCLKVPDQLKIVLDFAKKSGDRWYKAEAKYFGFDHGGVGGALLRTWNLPKKLQEAVAHHHFPASAKNYPQEAAIVNLADRISHHIVLDSDHDSQNFSSEKEAWDAVQLSEDFHLPQILEQTISQFEEVSEIFLQTA
ncbi:MAG: HDOD domain-containing protein [Nitrospina sp.]|jgi:HD-like signal output (HDOD) protein|nr:HDOD domain-containing protein [Nitrospina sp.]MBT5631553.1 HDOD domain-containing protein [Nitrospina sp.]